MMQCCKCGLIYCNPLPPIGERATLFSEEYFNRNYLSVESARMEYLRDHLGSVFQIKQVPGRWLDIGSGTGLLLSLVEEMGWDSYGVEPSTAGCVLAAQRTRAHIFNSHVEDACLSPEFFDVVSIWDVLSWTSDPMGICTQAVRLLKRNGLLVMKLPYLRERIYRLVDLTCHARNRGRSFLFLPGRMYSFPFRTIDVMCRTLGLKVVLTRSIDEVSQPPVGPWSVSALSEALLKKGLEILNGKPTYVVCAEKAE